MSLLSVALLLSAPPVPLPLEVQRVRGHVVCNQDGSPVRGARVKPQGVRNDRREQFTNGAGAFEMHDGPLCQEVFSTQDIGIEYLRVSAPDHASAFVDPCSRAPWADPIRLRPTGALTVNLLHPGRGPKVTVSIDAAELCWPPRSGLTLDDEIRTLSTWANRRIVIRDLPAQVPLFVSFDDEKLGTFVVLRPGEQREIDWEALSKDRDRFGPEPHSYSEYVSVYPSASAGVGEPELTWFAILTGGGRSAHGADRGHLHVHRYRACNHLGFLPGRSTLVARDARGWIGATPIEAAVTDEAIRPHVTLAPGALLRLDASDLAAPAHVTLSSSGVAFVVADLLPGVVRYEVVPAGTVQMRIEIAGRESQTREINAAAGTSLEVEL